MSNLLKEIENLSKEELKTIVLHSIGVYNKEYGNELPFVYCPLCGANIQPPNRLAKKKEKRLCNHCVHNELHIDEYPCSKCGRNMAKDPDFYRME